MKQTVSPYLHPESSLYPLPQQLRTALPGLTIVIATFNQARVLPRAVRPALMAAKNLRSQNIPANVLVIDNASRDGSMTLLRQLEAVYFEAGLRVLSLPQTFKPVVVHNKALVQASYRTLLMGDGDVEFFPENIPLFYQAAQEANAAAVYGNFMPPQAGTEANSGLNAADLSPWLQPHPLARFAFYDRHQIFDSGGFIAHEPGENYDAEALWSHLSACGRKYIHLPLLLGIYHG